MSLLNKLYRFEDMQSFVDAVTVENLQVQYLLVMADMNRCSPETPQQEDDKELLSALHVVLKYNMPPADYKEWVNNVHQ